MPKSKTDFTNFVDARPNYFPGQFLLEDDFEVEQKYLIDRQKYHRQSLHVSGIVEGLEVEVIKDKQEVQIKSGSAINSNGDLIILKKDTSFSKFAPLTNGELYISYKEEKQVKQQEDFTRWQEVPTIGFAATTPNDGVKLAKISIVNNVPNLDLTVRDYSGIFLPNATGNDLTLRSGGNANPNVAILNGSLTVTGTITGNIDATNINSGVLAVERIPNLPPDKITAGTTTGNLTIGGNLRVTGSLTADNKITVPGNQKIEFTDTEINNNLKLQLWTGYGLGINASTLFYAANGKHSWRDINGNNERMMLTTGADGFLTVNGTGTSSFAGNLRVSGAITPSAGNSESNGIMFPQNPGGGGGDAAWIRYWARSSENTTFEIGTSNDVDDHIALMPGAGNVGIGTTTPSEKLEVSGNLKVTGSLTAGNKITVPGNQKIEFTDTDITNNLKLQLWTGYGLGINGGTLFYAATGKHSWRDINGNNERMMLTTGADGFLTVNGTGTSSFAGNLRVSGAITPSAGNSESNGIMFPQNPGGGGGDAAWIRYWARSSENTTFEIGTSNDVDDHIALMPGAGNVGIGTTTPSAKLEVSGNLKVTGSLTAGGSDIYFTQTDHTHTGFGNTEGFAAIENASNYNALMILGRQTSTGRIIKVWDRFEVNGTFVNNSSQEHKQDITKLSNEDLNSILKRLKQTPVFRYRFKTPGIDGKIRLGVIAEQSPEDILDESGKAVSFLDYNGFLLAALKAQQSLIENLQNDILLLQKR